MSYKLPNLNGLKAFESAGRTMTFRAAAEELGVTQGAVAQQVRALEQELGQKLFHRKPKSLAFTTAGRSYHAQINQALSLIHEATQTLSPNEAKVTISVTPTFASKWLIPHLPELSMQHPNIDLRILATEQLSSFHGDGIDLVIRHGKPPSMASIETCLLFKNEIVAVASPTFLGNFKQPLSLDQLANISKLHDSHDYWPNFLSTLGIKDNAGHGIRMSQTALTIDAALSGQGAALTSRFLVEREIQSESLVEILQTVVQPKKLDWINEFLLSHDLKFIQ